MAHPLIIQRLITKFHDETGKQKRNTEFSRKWFRDRISKNIKNVRTPQILDGKKIKSKPVIGKMFLYNYNAKYKDILPVWDAQPLIFFVGPSKKNPSTNFLGLNLHYLAPKLRLLLFTELLRIRGEKRYRPSTKLNLSYSVLQSLSTSKYAIHAFKEYRYDHMMSKFIEIPAQEWEIVLFLPLARWNKGTKQTAWAI